MSSMSSLIRIPVLSLSLAPLMALAEDATPQPIPSRITEVMVYADRAQITRHASIKLAPGRHLLAFADLPDALDQGSVQVTGTGNAVLQDIRVEHVHSAQVADTKLRSLQERLTVLTDSSRIVVDAITNAQNVKAFVQKIADGVTTTGGKEAPAQLEPEKWVKMVAFYRDKLDALDAEIRSGEKSKRDLDEKTDLVQREIGELNSAQHRTSLQVQATVTVQQSGSIDIDLSYVVVGPQWSPQYDIRVSSLDKSMRVVYKAQVRQSTTEDWTNVKLSLSTAQPQVGGRHPELTPWYISLYQPPPRAEMSFKKTLRANAPMRQMMLADKAEAGAGLDQQEPPAPLEVAMTDVQTGTTAAVFAAHGTTTVKSDNQPSTVTITEISLPAEFRYSAVPKLAQHAYLKARATNATSYPFLAGPTSIFLDNAFVAHADMQLVAPAEEFWTFLGADDALRVEYKLVKRYQRKDGMLAKRECLVYEYQMTLTNNRKDTAQIVAWDQIPISSNQDVTVELIEPKYKADTDILKKNEFNYFEWLLTMKPGEVVKMPFSFSVTYPKGQQVFGL